MNTQPIDILLVEDNPDHVELIVRALRDNDLVREVHVVTTGEDALDFLWQRGEHADARQPGLILLDLKLPGMDGLEFLRRIKADPNVKFIPVVVLSASPNSTDIVESYNCGANSYVVKPVDFDQFLKMVKDLKLYWTIVSSLPM